MTKWQPFTTVRWLADALDRELHFNEAISSLPWQICVVNGQEAFPDQWTELKGISHHNHYQSLQMTDISQPRLFHTILVLSQATSWSHTRNLFQGLLKDFLCMLGIMIILWRFLWGKSKGLHFYGYYLWINWSCDDLTRQSEKRILLNLQSLLILIKCIMCFKNVIWKFCYNKNNDYNNNNNYHFVCLWVCHKVFECFVLTRK